VPALTEPTVMSIRIPKSASPSVGALVKRLGE
jgi:hypothetical protein